jgi:broad specificity phosphatase PhoE
VGTVELTLVRHGATALNAQRRFQGQTDISLSDEGRLQAARVAARLREEPIERIYTSDLVRARETASAIAAPHGLEPILDARLREFAFGAWEGLTWAEILAERPHLSEANWHHAQLYAPEGGEQFDAVCSRVRSFCDELVERGVRSAVAVTHAGTLHALLTVLDLPESKQAVPVNFYPASITRIVKDGSVWRLTDGPAAPP